MNNHPSLFSGVAGVGDPLRDAGPKIQDVAEVFALAREICGVEHRLDDDKDSPVLNAIRERKRENASALGLVAKWANYKKAKRYVTIHDPTSGEWHDLPVKDAPTWAQWEATKRSAIYKRTGDYGAFDLNAQQMRVIWEEESPPQAEEGIVEEFELPDD